MAARLAAEGGNRASGRVSPSNSAANMEDPESLVARREKLKPAFTVQVSPREEEGGRTLVPSRGRDT